MNKSYACIDDKVMVCNEKGDLSQREYSDNIDKILVQENVIETMNYELQELTKESQKYPEVREKFKPFLTYAAVGAVVVTAALCAGGTTGDDTLNTIFGSMNPTEGLACIIGTCGIGLCGLSLFSEYSGYKERASIGNGINSNIEYLTKQLEVEKEELHKLKEERTKEITHDKFKKVSVDDRKEIQALDNSLKLHYNIGYNFDKYYRYYQQGKLNKKLEGYFGKTGVEIIKESLEEKGPNLTKKKRY